MASTSDSDPEIDKSLKRKRVAEEPKLSKRAQKRRRAKHQYDDEEIDDDTGVNLTIGRMNPDLLADYVAKKTKRFEDQATPVELEDRRVPVSAFEDTSEWDEPRSLDNLPAFLERFAGGAQATKSLQKAPNQPGAPHTLVVTAAGLRAADVTRALRKYQSKECTVAKLFAKHMKLSETIDFLKKKRINIGVGTPARLIDLLETKSLNVDKLERLIVDASNVNQKRKGIMDMPETEIPLVDLLNREELKSRYSSGAKKIQLLFF